MISWAKRVWGWFARTQVWRAWKQYGERRGNRLAAATTFYGFLSIFPLIVLAAAITGRLLDEKAVEDLEQALRENLPGIANNIDIDSLIAHAGTIGLVSAVILLFTGLGWVDAMRASIRSMHELDDRPGNFVKLKLADLGALLGLGLLALLSTATSSVLSGLSDRIVDRLDLEGTWLASWGLTGISAVLGILSGSVLFLYLQTALPRIILPGKVAAIAALAGGIVFYGAQKLGNLYIDYVISNNQAYGALALPLALLVWLYLLTRIIMLVAAWAKEASLEPERSTAEAAEAAEDAEDAEASATGAPEASAAGSRIVPGASSAGHPEPAYRTVEIPQRKADRVAVAAGAVLGATATAIAVSTARAARAGISALLRR